MREKQILSNEKIASNFDLEKAERDREYRKKQIVGGILLSLHKKQGTEGFLIAAIEPHLRKGDRGLFGLV
jgi:hypothetical protein